MSNRELEDLLPLMLTKKEKCKRLKTNCSELEKKCNSTLEEALGSSKEAKNCATFFSQESKETKVKSFCAETCKECGMFKASIPL